MYDFSDYSWDEFIEDCLSMHTCSSFKMRYKNGASFGVSPCTVVNRIIVDRLRDSGSNAIAIGICDYSNESLSFTYGLALENALNNGSVSVENSETLKPGDIATYCGFNFKFTQYIDYSVGTSIQYLMPSGKTSQVLNQIKGAIYKTRPDVVSPVKDNESFGDAKNRYLAMSDSEKKLYNSLTDVQNSVLYVNSSSRLGSVPPTHLKDLEIEFNDGSSFLYKCLNIAHVGSDGSIKHQCEFPVDGIPAVVSFCRDGQIGDLSSTLDYIEDNENIKELVIDCPDGYTLESNYSCLEDILQEGLPVVVFCDEKTLRSCAVFEKLGFERFLWTNEALKSVKNIQDMYGCNLTKRQINYLEGARNYEPINDCDLFSGVSNFIHGLNDKRDILGERAKESLVKLNKILSLSLKQTEIPSLDFLNRNSKLVSAELQILSDSSYCSALSIDELNNLALVNEEFQQLLDPGCDLPKEDFVYRSLEYSLTHDRGICLIAPEASRKEELKHYWLSQFDDFDNVESLIKVYTCWEFLKLPDFPEDMDVFIPGWFKRDIMEMILNSGYSKRYVLYLYKFIDTPDSEISWCLNADNYWKSCRNTLKNKSKDCLAIIGVDASEIYFVPEKKKIMSIKSNNSIDDVIAQTSDKIAEDYARRYKPKLGEGTCLAKLVYFTNGLRRWMRVAEDKDVQSGDTVVTIVPVGCDAYEAVRQGANELKYGDMVLKTVADEEAIDAQCRIYDQKYEEDLEIAKKWREPIDEALRSMTENEIQKRIMDAGCRRTPGCVMSWIRGKRLSAPNHVEDILIINRALKGHLTEDDIRKIADAAKRVRGSRSSSGKSATSKVVQQFIDDINALGIKDAVDGFSERHGFGTVELLFVENISQSMQIGTSRLNYYSN